MRPIQTDTKRNATPSALPPQPLVQLQPECAKKGNAKMCERRRQQFYYMASSLALMVMRNARALDEQTIKVMYAYYPCAVF